MNEEKKNYQSKIYLINSFDLYLLLNILKRNVGDCKVKQWFYFFFFFCRERRQCGKLRPCLVLKK